MSTSRCKMSIAIPRQPAITRQWLRVLLTHRWEASAGRRCSSWMLRSISSSRESACLTGKPVPARVYGLYFLTAFMWHLREKRNRVNCSSKRSGSV